MGGGAAFQQPSCELATAAVPSAAYPAAMRNTIRPRTVRFVISVGVALAVAGLAPAQTTTPQARTESSPLRFAVTYEASITDSFTGRVYVVMTNASREPRRGPTWFGTQPFFALDVSGWKPGDELIFDDSALGYPGPLSSVEVFGRHGAKFSMLAYGPQDRPGPRAADVVDASDGRTPR